jgi:predicted anti-sigma-YlaC factor YlaD
MDCSDYRQAISARIDGETSGLEQAAVEAHLRTCRGCRGWADEAVAITRRARMTRAGSVPDLTAPIMAALPLGAGVNGASPAGVARLGLLLVAGAQLCLAVPALLGKDAGASIHIAHEQGSWSLALAVGLLVVAARPARAAGMLPLVEALAAGLAFTMALDIWAGRAEAAGEAPHGLAFLGLGLLWVLARPACTSRQP